MSAPTTAAPPPNSDGAPPVSAGGAYQQPETQGNTPHLSSLGPGTQPQTPFVNQGMNAPYVQYYYYPSPEQPPYSASEYPQVQYYAYPGMQGTPAYYVPPGNAPLGVSPVNPVSPAAGEVSPTPGVFVSSGASPAPASQQPQYTQGQAQQPQYTQGQAQQPQYTQGQAQPPQSEYVSSVPPYTGAPTTLPSGSRPGQSQTQGGRMSGNHVPAVFEQEQNGTSHYSAGVLSGSPLDEEGGILEDEGSKLFTSGVSTSVRHAFIRKVFALVAVGLADWKTDVWIIYQITFSLCLVFGIVPAAKEFYLRNVWLAIVSIVVSMICVFVIACFPSVGRRFPINLILFITQAAALGLVFGFICTRFNWWPVVLALGITIGVSLALILFACQTRWDFTGCGVYILIFSVVLLVLGIVRIFVHLKVLELVFAGLGALICCFGIIYDTQLIVGGKHRRASYTVDDYMLAALGLYLDLAYLFYYILLIITTASDS